MKASLKGDPDVFIPKNNDLVKLAGLEDWHQYQKFTIVRHPIQRLQSLRAMLLEQKRLKRSIHQILDLVEDPKLGYQMRPIEQYIKRHALPITHPHFQVWSNGKLQVDRWWRLEELQSRQPEIEAFLGKSLEIPILNSTRKRVELTESEIKRVEKIYQLDIQLFYTT